MLSLRGKRIVILVLVMSMLTSCNGTVHVIGIMRIPLVIILFVWLHIVTSVRV